jgi:hypothetical protein
MLKDELDVIVTLDSPYFSSLSPTEGQRAASEFRDAFQEIVIEVARRSEALGFSAEGSTLTPDKLQLELVSVREGSLVLILAAIGAVATSEIGKQVIAGVIVSVIGASSTAIWNRIRRKKANESFSTNPQPVPVVVQKPDPVDITNELSNVEEQQERIINLLQDGSITIKEVRTRRWTR